MPYTSGDIEQAVAESTLRIFEILLRRAAFVQVDMLLHELDPSAQHTAEIIAILTITFHGKVRLVERAGYFERAEGILRARVGDEHSDRLLEPRR